MSKSDMYMSSFHIYVQIVIYMSKLQYIYPNCNIYIQMVIYMHPKHKCCACPLSVLYITSYNDMIEFKLKPTFATVDSCFDLVGSRQYGVASYMKYSAGRLISIYSL